MSHGECQQFEERVNDVMDQRLDPNEDPRLKDHALECADCNELLQSFAKLHAGLSGPNKIPIALLASDSEKIDQPGRYRLIALGSSLAAMLLIGLTIVASSLVSHPTPHVASSKKFASPPLRSSGSFRSARRLSSRVDPRIEGTVAPHLHSLSFREISDGLRSHTVYQYSVELPGFRPIHSSLNLCIEWFQNSLFNFSIDRQLPADGAPAADRNSGFGHRLWRESKTALV